jgi:pilus assembly protein FimV
MCWYEIHLGTPRNCSASEPSGSCTCFRTISDAAAVIMYSERSRRSPPPPATTSSLSSAACSDARRLPAGTGGRDASPPTVESSCSACRMCSSASPASVGPARLPRAAVASRMASDERAAAAAFARPGSGEKETEGGEAGTEGAAGAAGAAGSAGTAASAGTAGSALAAGAAAAATASSAVD